MLMFDSVKLCLGVDPGLPRKIYLLLLSPDCQCIRRSRLSRLGVLCLVGYDHLNSILNVTAAGLDRVRRIGISTGQVKALIV